MAKVARHSAGEVRWLRIEDKRLIAPFNERAFALSVMNKPLSLIQRDAVEDVLGRGRFREGEAIAALHAALQAMSEARDAGEMVAPDVEFHLALIDAANNELLVPFGIIIEQALQRMLKFSFWPQ